MRIVQVMLRFEGLERITAEKALQHDYFRVVSSGCEISEGFHSPDCSSTDVSPDRSSSGSASPTSSSSILDLSISTDSGIQEP